MNRLIILVITALISSCANIITPDTELIGTWTWVGSSGGFAGTIETPTTTGDEISIEFTKSRYKKFVNGVLTENLRYSIKSGKSIFSSAETEIIKYGNGWKQTYSINESTLLLKDECYDCFQHEYKMNAR